MLVVAVLAFVACRSFAAGPKAIPIVLDSDIGGDIDDAFTPALVLAIPELDLRWVATVSGDTAARA